MTLSEKLEIPLFPLSVFLLPGERMQLHIFEPRYRQLFTELEQGNPMFGIPYVKDGNHTGYGARCRLVRVMKKYLGGESDVIIECEGLFKMEDYRPEKEGKLYPFGTVSLMRGISKERANAPMLLEYERLFEALSDSDVPLQCQDTDIVLGILSSLNPSSEQKYAIVRLEDDEERMEQVTRLISMMTLLIEQEKANEQGWYLN